MASGFGYDVLLSASVAEHEEAAVRLAPRTGGQPSRFAHDHPRCDSCRATEQAWQDCIVAYHREIKYVKKLEHNLSRMRERLYELYHALPSRRTKLARKVMDWMVGPDEDPPSLKDTSAHG